MMLSNVTHSLKGLREMLTVFTKRIRALSHFGYCKSPYQSIYISLAIH